MRQRVTWRLTRPCVHKETENTDQAQDQTYKLQLLDNFFYKFDEKFTILSGGLNLKAFETEVKLHI